MDIYSDSEGQDIIVYSSDVKLKTPDESESQASDYISYSVIILMLMYCVYSFMKMKSKRRTHEKEIYKFLEKQLRE